MGALFLATLMRMGMLFFFLAVGYVMKRTKLLQDGSADVLSKLEYYVFLPASFFTEFAANFTLEKIATSYPLLIAGLVTALLITLCLHFILPHFIKSKSTERVIEYGLTYPNTGYVGLYVVLSVLGKDSALSFLMFSLPYMLLSQAVGVPRLNPNAHPSFKNVLTPSVIAIFVGMIIGILGIKLHSFISGVVDSAALCMAPIAMLVTGITLAGYTIKELFTGKQGYIIAFIRLIVTPFVITAALSLLGLPKEVPLMACIALCMPFGLNAVLFAGMLGGDAVSGAKVTFLTHFAGVFTIPLAVSAAMALFG